jgi:hypothetical protein
VWLLTTALEVPTTSTTVVYLRTPPGREARLLTFPYKRSGLFPVQLPFTLGHDAVGTIVSLPKVPMAHTSLPPLQVGLRVLTCRGSAFAEYMVAPWWQVAPLPEGIDPKERVAMATTEFTSMYLLRGSYKVKKGDWVLIRRGRRGRAAPLPGERHSHGCPLVPSVLSPRVVGD